jgi:hypothetical protein
MVVADGAAPPDVTAALPGGPAAAGPAAAAPDAAAPDAAAPDAPALDTAAPDAAADVNPSVSGPRWQTLGTTGLSEHLAANFDLQVADDGTPFLVISKATPPRLSRVTIVLRYDGSDWEQLGSELPGSDVSPGFVLTGDGKPYVVVGGLLHVLQGDWQELPRPPAPSFIPTLPPVGLARDAQGRFYTFAGSPDPDGHGYLLGVLRLTGGSWQLLGPPDSFGSAPTGRDLQLAADREGPRSSSADQPTSAASGACASAGCDPPGASVHRSLARERVLRARLGRHTRWDRRNGTAVAVLASRGRWTGRDVPGAAAPTVGCAEGGPWAPVRARRHRRGRAAAGGRAGARRRSAMGC